MKQFSKFLTLTAVAAAAFSCNKEEVMPNYNISSGETILGASISQIESKMGFDKDKTGGYKATWKESDSISIYTAAGAKYADYGVVSIDSVTAAATFKGAALAMGEEYVAVFPKSDAATLSARNSEELVAVAQEGNKDNLFLKKNCKMSTSFAYDSTQTIAFNQELSLVTVKHSAALSPIAVVLDVDGKSYRVMVSEDGEEGVVTDISFLIPPKEASKKMDITFFAMDGSGYKLTKESTSVNLEAGTCYTANAGDYFKLESTIDQTNEFAVLKQRCVADLLGQSELNLYKAQKAEEYAAQGMADFAKSLRSNGTLNEANVVKRWNLMQPDGTWEDVDYASTQAGSWPTGNHLSYVLSMASLYQSPQSNYYKDEDLKADILKSFKYWTDRDFICPTNWFPRIIGIPSQIMKILIIMDGEVPASISNNALRIASRANWTTGATVFTGANKMSIANIFLYKGIVMKNAAIIKEAMAALVSEAQVVEFGLEGLQKDYTFHQHGPLLQTGNYGMAQAGLMTGWFNIVRGTQYAFKEEQVNAIRMFLLGGVNASVFNGELDVQGLGRQVSEGRMASRAIAMGILMVEMMPVDPSYLSSYEQYLKRNFTTPYLNDYVGNFYFDCSKYMMHRTEHSMFGIRMVSNKVYGGERVNDENINGFFLGDGAALTYYNRGAYESIFSMWNPFYIPGTTTIDDESKKPNWGNNVKYTQAADFVGGIGDYDDTFGVAAMEFNRNFVTANKAYFCINNKMICLGNSVNCTGGDSHTTLEQNHFRGEKVVYDYRGSINSGGVGTEGTAYRVISDGVGYQSLDGKLIDFSVDAVTGNLQNVALNAKDVETKGNLFKAYFTHETPSDTYAYMVETGADETTFFDEEKELDFDIASNTYMLSAVESTDHKVGMYIFWTAGTFDSRLFGEIKVDQPLIIKIKGDRDNFTSECSNPIGSATSYSIGGVAQ